MKDFDYLSEELEYVVDKLGYKIEVRLQDNWNTVRILLQKVSPDIPWYMPYEIIEIFFEARNVCSSRHDEDPYIYKLWLKNVYAEIGMNIEKINTDTIQTQFGQTTVLEGLKQAKPENIYIMLGSNGIAWLSVSDMISYYSEFVDSVKQNLPDSNIYILSIPPVTAARESAEEEPILNSDIDKYNSELLKMADEKKIYYVDINTALKGNDGKFPEENAAEDGMHFKKTTYSIMLDYILSHTANNKNI